MRQRANFSVKKAVSENPLIIKSDLGKVFGDEDINKGSVLKRVYRIAMFYVFKSLRSFFTIFYYYFFPFIVIWIPF